MSLLSAAWRMVVFLGLAAGAQAYTLFPSMENIPMEEDSPGSIRIVLAWSVTGTPGNGTVQYSLATDPPSGITSSGTINVSAANGASTSTLYLSYSDLPAQIFDLIITPTSATNVTVAQSYRIGVFLPPASWRIATVSGGSVVEGNAGTVMLNFTVSLNLKTGSTITFQYTTGGGTAVSGEDYQPVSGTGTIHWSGTSTTVSVPVNGDLTVEDNETVELQVSNFSVVLFQGTHTAGTILTDDFAPAVLEQDNPFAAVTEDAGGMLRATLLFRVSGVLRENASVNFSLVSAPDARLIRTGVMNLTAGGPAAQSIPLSFAYSELPGEDFHIVVTPTQVTPPPGSSILSTAAGYDFTLHFDGVRILTVSGGSVPEGNAGPVELPFTLTLNKTLTAPLSFTCTPGGGTAVAGQDYGAGSSTVTIPAGTLTTTVNVIVLKDTIVEPDETVGLTLSAFSVAVKPGASTPGTILADQFSSGVVPGATLVTEASGTDTAQAWFAVELPVARPGALQCRVSTRNGTALAGSDYRALAATTVTFAPGETLKWVSITVTASAQVEAREEFFLDVEALDTHEVLSAACTIERFSVTAFSRVSAGIYNLRFPTGLGQRYLVEESASLSGGWTPASSLLAGTGSPVTQLMFSDGTRGFFRVRAALPLPPGVAAVSS